MTFCGKTKCRARNLARLIESGGTETNAQQKKSKNDIWPFPKRKPGKQNAGRDIPRNQLTAFATNRQTTVRITRVKYRLYLFIYPGESKKWLEFPVPANGRR